MNFAARSLLHRLHQGEIFDQGKSQGWVTANLIIDRASKAEIVTKCNEIGATPLVTDSNAMFYQLKSYLQDHMETDDLWSDFKDG